MDSPDLLAEPAEGRRCGSHHLEHVMGMVVSIDVRDQDVAPTAIPEVVAWLRHVDAMFSTHRDDSVLTALGRGELVLDDVDEDVRSVLRISEELRVDSDGVFDVFAVPAPNGTTLDPSGLVKGWAIERAAEILEGHGCRDFCINAGGDVAVRGRPFPGAQWRIGIRHPAIVDALATVVFGSGRLAIATSATYERGAHIIDPRTGEPSTTIASATVVGPDLTMADAYATIVFIMGLDGLAWMDLHPDYEAYVITHDATTHCTDGFLRYHHPDLRPAP